MAEAPTRAGWWRATALFLIALILTGGFLVVWAFWWEPGRLVVRETRLELRDWPEADEGLRVALLADLHVGSPRNGVDNLRRVVRRTNQAAPDLVLMLGDILIDNVVGGDWVSPEDVARELAALEPRLGTYAVLGNHDRWLSVDRVTEALESAEIVVLEDRAVRVADGNAGFWIAGVSDFWTGPHDIGAALSEVADDRPVLLITHNPDVFPDVPERVSLAIAGHTHGGQVRLPPFGRIIVPSLFGERFAAGHVVEGDQQFFVSTGVGTSRLAVRFLVPPEISILRLHGSGVRR